MSSSPRVSIVMPIFNDEEWVAASLETCLKQTVKDFEVICVDDASTDGTRRIVEEFQRRDSRVRLVAQDVNRSAFQARRAGIYEAKAPYILFLDGDDELAPNAVEVALRTASQHHADLVGFGVEIMADDGRQMGRFEKTLQPRHSELHGSEIMRGLFPVGEPAQGHLWRYLFRTQLLRSAYEGFPADLTIYRANDLPITFLAVAAARTYVSTPARLYRYRFGRGTSGRRITTIDDFRFFFSGIDSIEHVAAQVHELSAGDASTAVAQSYDSARLSIIAHVIKYLIANAPARLHKDGMAMLVDRVGALDLVRATLAFAPSALATLTETLSDFPTTKANRQHVVLTTANLSTGGVQSVLITQAQYLVAAGFRVTVVIHDPRKMAHTVPAGTELVVLDGSSPSAKLDAWVDVLSRHNVDLVIDHHVLYNERWPFYALAARTLGIETIGWLHSFALRQLSDSRDRTSFLVKYLPLLARVVALSPTDVAFWKLRGVDHTVYLPNPPSTFLEQLEPRNEPKQLGPGPIELVWWGRLQQSTKQVGDLILLAENLTRLEVDFRLTLIGPDGDDLTARTLRARADELGLSDKVVLPGALHGKELESALSSAHLFVSTSVVEGYQLTILEAQTLGLPVAMYDLPWLVLLENNHGAITVPQGDVHALAQLVADLSDDPVRYEELSEASIAYARKSSDIDISALYASLVSDTLPEEYSPSPTCADAALLLEWTFFYAERTTRAFTRLKRNHDRDKSALSRKLAKHQHEIGHIRSGMSFRIGRALTLLPRKLFGRN